MSLLAKILLSLSLSLSFAACAPESGMDTPDCADGQCDKFDENRGDEKYFAACSGQRLSPEEIADARDGIDVNFHSFCNLDSDPSSFIVQCVATQDETASDGYAVFGYASKCAANEACDVDSETLEPTCEIRGCMFDGEAKGFLTTVCFSYSNDDEWSIRSCDFDGNWYEEEVCDGFGEEHCDDDDGYAYCTGE